jgi:hypothetical protein
LGEDVPGGVDGADPRAMVVVVDGDVPFGAMAAAVAEEPEAGFAEGVAAVAVVLLGVAIVEEP